VKFGNWLTLKVDLMLVAVRLVFLMFPWPHSLLTNQTAATDQVAWRQRKWIIQIPGLECGSYAFNDCTDATGKHSLNINSLEDQTARWFVSFQLYCRKSKSQLRNYYTGRQSHLANISLLILAKNVLWMSGSLIHTFVRDLKKMLTIFCLVPIFK
jgi:hypothetical protein